MYLYYTKESLAKQGVIVHKEFFHLGVEIGRTDWYNIKK